MGQVLSLLPSGSALVCAAGGRLLGNGMAQAPFRVASFQALQGVEQLAGTSSSYGIVWIGQVTLPL
jgi:hypothetical protein